MSIGMCTISSLAALACIALPVGATPSVGEMQEAERWSSAKLGGVLISERPTPRLDVAVTHGLIQRNAYLGKPLAIGKILYQRGLFCHAPTKLNVFLPGGAKDFSAAGGIHTNWDTKPGKGSVEFVVKTGDKEVFRSGVTREGMPPVPVKAPLGNASEFSIEVTDGGDGIAHDQACLADARITMADGSVIWLDDLYSSQGLAEIDDTDPPFSFIYDGKASRSLLTSWREDRSSRRLDGNRTEYVRSYTDPTTGLLVRCVGIRYSYFPTVEWTVCFRNTGANKTPIIEGIKALDMRVRRDSLVPEYEYVLHRNRGTVVTTTDVPSGKHDYEPVNAALLPGKTLSLTPPQGRPCAGEFPYFNLESCGRGLIMVVGWPGQWTAEFVRDAGSGLEVRAGQTTTRFSLLPGEEVRTPLMVLQFWQGERVEAQNTWRRWMLAHNTPKPGGKPLQPMTGGFDGYYFAGLQIPEVDENKYIDRYVEEKLVPDFWWIDAGWYPGNGTWTTVGTWEADKDRFPNGLRGVTSCARKKGMKSIVWFEPERVSPGSWIDKNHPEWVLQGGLLNLGNPDAWNWVVSHLDRMFCEEGIDAYRQDFNMDPLGCWRSGDSSDRQGITENHYVTGYLAFWDELLRRHPDLFIDSCASGGHRNDLETLRRSVPLWRSDYPWDPTGMQCQTYGFSSWVPYQGTGVVSDDPYVIKSDMAPFFLQSWDMRQKLDYAAIRKTMAQWKEIADYYLGDYYPLSRYSLEEDAWLAMQWNCPERGEGMVQAFRRPDSPHDQARYKLRGLDMDASYSVRNLDAGKTRKISGRELMEKGLPIATKDSPSAVFVVYKRAK